MQTTGKWTEGELFAHLGRRCAGIIQEDAARIEILEAENRAMRTALETIERLSGRTYRPNITAIWRVAKAALGTEV